MLELDNVTKTFRTGMLGRGAFHAVRNVSFTVGRGEVVSLIGESGSGKTTVGRMILRLAGVTSGRILFDGEDISQIRGAALKPFYRKVQGVFQDPFSSYNPIFRVERVFEAIRRAWFAGMGEQEWREKLETAIQSVRLDPRVVLGKYPHQLSGGQLQRLLVARALLLDISLLVADEIISMLDASTRIDVLNLLGDLKQRGLGIVFVTHDLSLGNYISDKTVILRHGAVVEMGATEKVFGDPRHPYTRMLLASVPQLRRRWSPEELKRAAPSGHDGEARATAAAELVPVGEDHLVATG